jgi:hypothetical protein
MKRLHSMALTLLGLGALSALVAAGCEPAPYAELQTVLQYEVAEDGNDRASLRDRWLADLQEADSRIWAAVNGDVMDQEVADAMIQAHQAGADVRVVADVEDQGTEGFQALDDAEVPVTYGDGELLYLPDPNLSQVTTRCRLNQSTQIVTCDSGNTSSPLCDRDSSTQGAICRPDSFNTMSHRFVIVDEHTVWNLANGFEDMGEAGALGWKVESEVVREDFEREFRQMDGTVGPDTPGRERDSVFATTLGAYDGILKSRTDNNVVYLSNQPGALTIRFNPQERLMKEVIDAVYRARSSVTVISPRIRNPFLLGALEYKANNGFQVDVTIGEGAQPQDRGSDGPRSRLQALGARTHPAGENLPTLVLIDQESTPQRQWPRSAIVLSHPLERARPLQISVGTGPGGSDEVLVYPSDAFIDGNLWKIFEYESNTGQAEPIDRFARWADRIEQATQELQ